jgi:hypothetical protein
VANPISTFSEPTMIVSSREFVVYEQSMMHLLGANYTIDRIREETEAQPFGE